MSVVSPTTTIVPKAYYVDRRTPVSLEGTVSRERECVVVLVGGVTTTTLPTRKLVSVFVCVLRRDGMLQTVFLTLYRRVNCACVCVCRVM